MEQEYFQELVAAVGPKIQNADTMMLTSIKPDEQVAVALRFLATRESFQSLQYQFRISRTAISEIVIETCYEIINSLGRKYLKTPSSEEEWLQVSEMFESRWNFPNGLGAIDGKRIVIQQPPNSGSHYFDYEGNNSLILLTLVGPTYEIHWADVGCNGRASDGTIWNKSDLKNHLSSAENGLHVPPPAPLPGRELVVLYVITGDDAFGLKTFLMKPYPLSGLSNERRIYNYRLSRMRRVSENAFRILANKWRIFLSPVALEPEKVQMITLPAPTLHNFLLSKKTSNCGNIDDLSMGDVEVTSSLLRKIALRD